MVVEQLHQLACHEEFLRNIALERRLDLVVVLILTQPIVQRNREAELLFVRGTLRQLLDSRAAQGDLRRFVCCTVAGRNACGKLQHLFIEERYAQLKGVCHTHAVGFQ